MMGNQESNTAQQTTARKWWAAALWALVSPPTAFLYTGKSGWAGAGFLGLVAWIVFCLAAGFIARIYGTLVVLLIGLVYSALPVLFALMHRRVYRKRPFNSLKWYLGSAVAWLLCLLFIQLTMERTIGLGTFEIKAGSMENTLLAGDYVLADMRAYDRVTPQRGDVVLVRFVQRGNTLYTKRVAGVPGDTIQLKYKLLYVNGKLTSPPRTATYQDPDRIFPSHLSPRDNYGPTVVPAGQYFTLGDNRDNSFDSRFGGFVPRNMIMGRAMMVIFSREGLVTRLERLGMRLDDYQG